MSQAEGLLENVAGKYQITSIEVRIGITLKGEVELEPDRETMENIEAHCWIAHSMRARVTLTPEFAAAG
jgi:hypothetical protein